MKNNILLYLILISIMFLGCSFKKSENIPPIKSLDYSKNGTQLNYEKNEEKFFITENIFSPSLENNKLNDPVNQPVRIFLPLSYYVTHKKYPVIYYLHGFGSSFLEIEWYKKSYKKLISDKITNEFILVGINGRNKFGGSFYVNSPVTGNWEDYIIKDVVNFIDTKYHTIPNPNSRGIAGFSMGGFGCINIGFKHSDIFSYLFAISPAIFNENDIQKTLKTWEPEMLNAYATAFASNLNNPYPYVDFPKFDNSRTDNIILGKWKNGIGTINGRVTTNINSIRRLADIQIEFGTKDFFDWIPNGCRLLSNISKENNIQNKLIQFEGSHGDKNDIIVEKDMFPYFSRLLKAE